MLPIQLIACDRILRFYRMGQPLWASDLSFETAYQIGAMHAVMCPEASLQIPGATTTQEAIDLSVDILVKAKLIPPH